MSVSHRLTFIARGVQGALWSDALERARPGDHLLPAWVEADGQLWRLPFDAESIIAPSVLSDPVIATNEHGQMALRPETVWAGAHTLAHPERALESAREDAWALWSWAESCFTARVHVHAAVLHSRARAAHSAGLRAISPGQLDEARLDELSTDAWYAPEGRFERFRTAVCAPDAFVKVDPVMWCARRLNRDACDLVWSNSSMNSRIRSYVRELGARGGDVRATLDALTRTGEPSARVLAALSPDVEAFSHPLPLDAIGQL